MKPFSLENDTYLRLIGIPLLGISIPYITILSTPCSSHAFWMEYPHFYAIFVVACIFESNRFILLYFRKKFPNMRDVVGRISFQLVVQIMVRLGLLFALLYIWYKHILGAIIYLPFLYNNLYVGITIPLIITLLYEANHFVSKWKEAFERNKQLEIEHIKTQLHLVKKQLDPHFLFNSLSTLSSLIETQPKLALKFVADFSEVYRYILTHKDQTTAKLSDELGFVKAYINLLKERFGKGLLFEASLKAADKRFQVPTLSIQMLVENAIKHNAFNHLHPLKIEVFIDQDYLVVQNNIKRKQLTKSSTHTGLNNIVQRYALLGDYEIHIHHESDFFRVEMPLLKKPEKNDS